MIDYTVTVQSRWKFISKENNKLLTIGQFAKIHEINKKTLMWYDEIGLLKPVYVKENGYRYYSYQQSSILETILMLRELNISLPEIQEFINERSISNLENILDEKIDEITHTIKHLKSIQTSLKNRKEEIKSLSNLDLSKISIVSKDEEYLACVKSSIDMSFEKELESIIDEAKKHNFHHLRDASYVSMISVDKLYSNQMNDYDALYIKLNKVNKSKNTHIKPSGNYLQAYVKGSWDKIPNKYKEILDYAKLNDLELYGFAYERGINELVIDNIDEYITKIEIPIK